MRAALFAAVELEGEKKYSVFSAQFSVALRMRTSTEHWELSTEHWAPRGRLEGALKKSGSFFVTKSVFFLM